MTNLVPMAGEGKRFKDAGFKTPKPLINVSGKPMIIQAIRTMPPSDEWVFVCRKDHVDNYKVDKVLRKELPDCEIITIDKTTEGQACTCLLAKDLIDKKKPLFIGACDNGIVYNKDKWNKATNSGADALILSFTRQPNLTRDPRAWGWIKVGRNNLVKGMSVKVPISNNPYNDQAVVGSFWFKSGQTFINAAEELIRKNIRIKNEFYVDSLPDVMIPNGKKVYTFPVERYVGWGTPADLKEYEYWSNVILNNKGGEGDKKNPFYQFWKKYFLDDLRHISSAH